MSASGTGSDGTSASVAAIAGAIAEVVRESINRTLTPQPSVFPGRAQDTSPSVSPFVAQPPSNAATSVGTAANLYQRVATLGSPPPGASSHRSEIQRQGALPGTSRQSSFNKRFATPTMFMSKRSRRTEPQPKKVTYMRDIFCLPRECQGQNGTVLIPRGSRRSALANKEVGLLGKIEFDSNWSPERMQQEILAVFSKPLGLSEEDLAAGKVFNFDYLQRTGAGSRTLCVPSVTNAFQWNGRQVATLAKSGGVIYILAHEDIPAVSKLLYNKGINYEVNYGYM